MYFVTQLEVKKLRELPMCSKEDAQDAPLIGAWAMSPMNSLAAAEPGR
jgi:hypothetical protein